MGAGEIYIGFWWGDLMQRDQLEDVCQMGYNIKMDLQEVEWEDMDWI